jgi:hypothetical protein
MDHDAYIAISHNYAIYARALDEKRFEYLDQVFTPTAALHYEVSGHVFDCTGAGAVAAFSQFLDLCYWTNHVIASPMIEITGRSAHASARVIATHLQRLPEGTLTRWEVRGSYHDTFALTDAGWRITRRHCVCMDSDGEFLADGVERFPALAWSDAAALAWSDAAALA